MFYRRRHADEGSRGRSAAYRPLLASVGITSLLIVGGASATGRVTQGDTRQTITIQTSRPLADVVETLQGRLGVVITYEDPPYLHASQIRDATAEFRRRRPSAPRTYIPRGGPFSFTYEMGGWTLDEQAASILESLVQEYRSQGYGGDFHIEKTGSLFHVVPSERRSRDGRDEAFQPILSTVLQIQGTRAEQSALEALRELVDTIGRTVQARIGLATVPTNLLVQSRVTANAGTRTAREELVRILATTGRRLSWQLFFDPNEPEGWYLNISIAG